MTLPYDVPRRLHAAIVKQIRAAYDLPVWGSARIYLLHFDQPVGHAKHYLGFTGFGSQLEVRLTQHATGRGSALCRALRRQGGTFRLALTFRVPLDRARTIERRLKRRGSGTRFCPYCHHTFTALRNEKRRARYQHLKGALA